MPADYLSTLRSRLDASSMEPNPEVTAEGAELALSWCLNHFSSLPDQGIGRTATRAELEKLLREPIPEHGKPFAEALAEFEAKIAAHALSPGHPRFFAFIPGPPTFVSILGELLTATTNYFAGVWVEAAGPSQVEIVLFDWFKELLGLPKEASGILTSGGSEANLTALVVARQPLRVEDRQRAVIYVSGQRHLSMDRAAMIAGFQPDQIRSVPVDNQFRLRPEALSEMCSQDRAAGRLPWLVTANAGSTNTGAVDPLDAVADMCKRENLWLHIDAAYGWSAVLVPEGKQKLRGIERADSITLDPHKWFAQPFETGGIIVRDGRLLPQTFAMRPDYMQDVEPNDAEINFADYSLALTRRFRALKIWLSLKVFGLDWFRKLVQRCLDLAEYAERLIEEAEEFEIVTPRQLSIVTFRLRESTSGVRTVENDPNLQLVDRLFETGRAFLSTTRLNGVAALRLCFVNWRTQVSDVDEVVTLLTKFAREMRTQA